MGSQPSKDSSNEFKTLKLNNKINAENSNDPSIHDLIVTQLNKWESRENLLYSNEISENSQLYVALYDFDSSIENQVSLKKGDQFNFIKLDLTGEWSWIELHNNLKANGWVPTTFIAPVNGLDRFSWYHGALSRTAAEYLLSSGINGSFLVRESESYPDQLSISLRYDGIVYHYRINKEDNKLFISPNDKFGSLAELVHHHSLQSSGLICCLQFPMNKLNQRPMIYGLPSLTTEGIREISRSEIKMQQILGSGQYGDVYNAVWTTNQNDESMVVAVKTLKLDVMNVKDFMSEAILMSKMKHKHLVKLIGVCTREPPYYIITEFMKNGNLLNYLQSHKNFELGPQTLLYMATQVASAMVYLEANNFIHRDLAARNCLVGDNHLIKVADFGLARLIIEETYTAHIGSKFPIKWTAPEGLAYNKFSTKSDVWAFGILLWELSTFGMTPYPSVTLNEVYPLLEGGYRLPIPKGCPNDLYIIMLECWKWSPEERPSFKDIHLKLDNTLIPTNTELSQPSFNSSKMNKNKLNEKSDNLMNVFKANLVSTNESNLSSFQTAVLDEAKEMNDFNLLKNSNCADINKDKETTKIINNSFDSTDSMLNSNFVGDNINQVVKQFEVAKINNEDRIVTTSINTQSEVNKMKNSAVNDLNEILKSTPPRPSKPERFLNNQNRQTNKLKCLSESDGSLTKTNFKRNNTDVKIVKPSAPPPSPPFIKNDICKSFNDSNLIFVNNTKSVNFSTLEKSNNNKEIKKFNNNGSGFSNSPFSPKINCGESRKTPNDLKKKFLEGHDKIRSPIPSKFIAQFRNSCEIFSESSPSHFTENSSMSKSSEFSIDKDGKLTGNQGFVHSYANKFTGNNMNSDNNFVKSRIKDKTLLNSVIDNENSPSIKCNILLDSVADSKDNSCNMDQTLLNGVTNNNINLSNNDIKHKRTSEPIFFKTRLQKISESNVNSMSKRKYMNGDDLCELVENNNPVNYPINSNHTNVSIKSIGEKPIIISKKPVLSKTKDNVTNVNSLKSNQHFLELVSKFQVQK